MNKQDNYWQRASQGWNNISPPHYPTEQDVTFSSGVIEQWSVAHGTPRAMIMGVTPQLYHMRWPAGTDLIAMDNAPLMIESVWPGNPDAAILDDWTVMSLPDASRDILITDGGLSVISFAEQLPVVLKNIERVLAPGGLFIARLYAPPSERESIESVIADLRAGKIGNLSLLKTRLWFSMQESPAHGISVADLWNAFHELEPDLGEVAMAIGWDIENLSPLEAYKGSYNRYYFFSPETLFEICERLVSLRPVKVFVPTYEQGEWCPTVVLERKG